MLRKNGSSIGCHTSIPVQQTILILYSESRAEAKFYCKMLRYNTCHRDYLLEKYVCMIEIKLVLNNVALYFKHQLTCFSFYYFCKFYFAFVPADGGFGGDVLTKYTAPTVVQKLKEVEQNLTVIQKVN